MMWKQCQFCAECKANYPEDIALTLYPPEMKVCPRCRDDRAELVDSIETPRYHGAPLVLKSKPQLQKTMFG